MIDILVRKYVECKSPLKYLPFYLSLGILAWISYYIIIPHHINIKAHNVWEIVVFIGFPFIIFLYKKCGLQEPEDKPEDFSEIEALTDALIERDEKIRTAKEMLQGVLDNVPARIYWKNLDLRYIGVNKTFAKDVGLPVKEIIGKTDLEFSWAESEASYYRREDRQVIDTNEPILSIEHPQTRRDGSKAIILSSKVPLHDNGGNVIGVLGMYEDITKKVYHERELRRSRKKWKDFFHNSLVGMYQADFRTSEILECNQTAAKIFGYNNWEEVVGQSILQFYTDPSDRDRVFSIIFKQGHIKNLEIKMRRKSGEMIWCRAHIFLYEDEGIIEGVFTDFYPDAKCEELRNGTI